MAKTHQAAGKRGDGERRPKAPLPPTGGQRVGARRFLNESWAELRKVQWPSRQSVVQGTLVVGIVTVFFGVFLSVVDYLAVRLVSELDKYLS